MGEDIGAEGIGLVGQWLTSISFDGVNSSAIVCYPILLGPTNPHQPIYVVEDAMTVRGLWAEADTLAVVMHPNREVVGIAAK